MNTSNNSFLGTGWSFPPTFDHKSGQVELVSELDSIEQSLHVLLSTSLGERIMVPDYGCNLDDYMFESLNNTLIGLIKDHVENAILYYEPRILVKNVEITRADSMDLLEGRFTIIVDYLIPETNSRYNYVYDYYLREGSGL